MPRQSLNVNDEDIEAFANSVPPPPYPGNPSANYDLTPTPQSVNRPRLPEERRNPRLSSLPDDVTIVKFQTIVREGKEIIIGRIKVPTPGSTTHAFILRRYDTNAVSLTTMYKVAFPGASEEDEKREMDWVRSSYDTRDTNGGRECEAVRLAGQWVSRHLAIHLAPAYGISDLVSALARAQPDPNVSYRKSQRSQAAADDLARQKVAQDTGTDGNARVAPSVDTPANASAPTPKRARRVAADEASTATQSEGSGESRRLTLEATTTVTAPAGANIDMNAEIESAKQLVRDLKRELQLRNAAGEELEEQGFATGSNSRGVKRLVDDDGVEIASGSKKGERVIKRNRRVEGGAVGTAKRVAFGAMLFGLGASAALFLPQFAASYF